MPSPPPSNLEPPQTTVGRPILKSIAPSKRPALEKPTQNCYDKAITENVFLPKELSGIFAIRQRRERVRPACLMILQVLLAVFKVH